MDNAEKVKRLQVPILFISGMRDELVPCRHMRKLFDVSRSLFCLKEALSLCMDTVKQTCGLWRICRCCVPLLCVLFDPFRRKGEGTDGLFLRE